MGALGRLVVIGLAVTMSVASAASGPLLQMGEEFAYLPGPEGPIFFSGNGERVAITVCTAPANVMGGCSDSTSLAVRVYEWDCSTSAWNKLGADLTEVDSPTSSFGRNAKLSHDGTRLAISNEFYNDGQGKVYTYEWIASSSSWMPLGDTGGMLGGTGFERAGESIDISGDGNRVAIVSPSSNANGENSGAVRVYELKNGQWTMIGQTGDLYGPAANNWGGGVSLSYDGAYVAMGSHYNSNSNGEKAGTVRVFSYDPVVLDGGYWGQMGASIDGPGPSAWAGMREAVSLSSDGKRVAIGAWTIANGYVQVYEYRVNPMPGALNWQWYPMGAALDDSEFGGRLGYGVSLSGDGTRLAVVEAGSASSKFTLRVYDWTEGLDPKAHGGETSAWIRLAVDDDYTQAGKAVSLSKDGRRVAVARPKGFEEGYVARAYELGTSFTPCAPALCSTSQYLKDGSCVACPSSISSDPMDPTTPPSSTSAGGDATYCTCPDEYYAATGALAGEWSCYPCGDNFEISSSRVPTVSGNSDVCDCKAGYYLDSTGLMCYECPAGQTSAGGRVTECTSASTPVASSPPPPSAQALNVAAEETRDAILADIADPDIKKKAKLLADAAIAGETVQKLSAKLTAADPDAACSSAYSKASVSPGKGVCVAAPDAAGRRRLSQAAYNVELMFKSSEVSDADLAAAVNELKGNGVEGVTSQASVNPITELKTFSSVDTTKLQTFETQAAAAAAAPSASAQTPPTPPPPKPNLVLDDDDAAVGLGGGRHLLAACVAAMFALSPSRGSVAGIFRPGYAALEMRSVVLLIVLFLAHVGRSPAEAYPTGPGGCSAIDGHVLAHYDDQTYWKLVHDGGSAVSPNGRVVVRLFDIGGGGYPFKGFILKTSAGTLTVKDSANTQAVSACDGAIGHLNSDNKISVEAYLDLPSTWGTVTVTAEIVPWKTSVTKLTLDIDVLKSWDRVTTIQGNSVIGEGQGEFGKFVSLSYSGSRMAVGSLYWVNAFEIDAGTATQLGTRVDVQSDPTQSVSISGDGESVAVIFGEVMKSPERATLTRVFQFDSSGSEPWTSNFETFDPSHPMSSALSSDGKRLISAYGRSPGTYLKVFDLETGTALGGAMFAGSSMGGFLGRHMDQIVAVSADGNRVATGVDTGNDENNGYEGLVNIWEWSGSSWTQMGTAIYGPSAQTMRFGDALALSGNGSRIVIGATGPPNIELANGGMEPFVCVYEWISGSWIQLGSNLKHGPENGIIGGDGYPYFFGRSVAISHDGTLIAVRSESQLLAPSQYGYTFVYSFDVATNDWKAIGKIKDEDLGYSRRVSAQRSAHVQVALSGDGRYLAVGEPNRDNVADTVVDGRVSLYANPWRGDPRATGGTVTTVGEYTIHTFTSTGTFTVTDSTLTEVEVLVVGGGGSGGGPGNTPASGGGGGGGVLTALRSIDVQSYTVTVGDGAGTYDDGGYSAFDDMVVFGGKGIVSGYDGGASGYCTLGSWLCNGVDYGDASGNLEAQRAGGVGSSDYCGGGAGAGGVGQDATIPNGGKGGDGILSSISGTATYYGGGGGGGSSGSSGGSGGLGGGGNGADGPAVWPKSGEPNTGGGGGGNGGSSSFFAEGGSGIVIVRYNTLAATKAAARTITTTGRTASRARLARRGCPKRRTSAYARKTTTAASTAACTRAPRARRVPHGYRAIPSRAVTRRRAPARCHRHHRLHPPRRWKRSQRRRAIPSSPTSPTRD